MLLPVNNDNDDHDDGSWSHGPKCPGGSDCLEARCEIDAATGDADCTYAVDCPSQHFCCQGQECCPFGTYCCDDASCCNDVCTECVLSGILSDGMVEKPDAVCVGQTITWTASGVTDLGGTKRINCVEQTIADDVRYEWTLQVPPDYPPPLPEASGIGETVTVAGPAPLVEKDEVATQHRRAMRQVQRLRNVGAARRGDAYFSRASYAFLSPAGKICGKLYTISNVSSASAAGRRLIASPPTSMREVIVISPAISTESPELSAEPNAPARTRRSHRGIFVLVALLVAGAAAVGWRAATTASGATKESATDPARAAVAVRLAPVESGIIRDVRVLSGSLAASTRFDVAAKVGGLLTEILVDIGDEVSRGDVVARIDDEEFVQATLQAQAELAVREAELARAQADLERVTYDFERIESLHQSDVASDVEFSEVSTRRAAQKAAIALAEARVRQATASLELADIQKRHATVRAAWTGPPDRATVGVRHEETGDTIQDGDPIVTIVGLDPLKALVSVTEDDYAQLSVGQTATLTTDARPGETFEATVARIAPIFEEASRQARIELTVQNPDLKLRPGMFIRLRVVLREEIADTIVPASAIVERSGRKVVFTADADGGIASEHWVKTGIEAGERVQLLSPHLTGQVVVLGQHLLEDGAPITIDRAVEQEL